MLGTDRKKRKPTQLDWPNEGPVTAPDAWKRLKTNEFALWVRLCAESPDELEIGRRAIAERLKWSYRNFNHVLKSLRDKGFVTIVAAAATGTATRIGIRRAMKIKMTAQFVASIR